MSYRDTTQPTTSVFALRNRHFLLIDLLLLPATAVLSFALRLDATGMQRYVPAILLFVALAVPVKLVVFTWLGLYSRFWRYASVDEILLVTVASGISALLAAALLFGLALPLSGITGFPRSIPLIDGLLTLLVVGGPRFALRLAEQNRQRQRRRKQRRSERRVLVVGAGDAGAMIVREMRANPQVGLLPVGFVDDDERKHGVRIHGLPVLGDRERIPELVQDYQVAEVIIAMPTAPGAAIREIVGICNQADVAARTIPGLCDILSGQVSVSQIRNVDIEDLLRRDPVQTDVSAVERMLRGCRVLVTGAGGSIGSELCRQIARCEPAALILMGHGENSIFEIYNELDRGADEQRSRGGGGTQHATRITYHASRITYHAVIADVRDPERLHQVFEAYRPEILFHAAAHKHVPLMERNCPEAVTNNVQGTAHLLHLSEAFQVGRFVLISTDKAVNPCSVMGATKRVAELLVQESARRSGRAYVAVRFGNVLGSRGSVVPLFREQIARGGPVTVTHPDARRYFMTIPEAVQLVLQAAALGQGGEVFLLDMGEPIRIVDLARDLIELSGLEVGRDVDIVYTGLRPGEKLFEELLLEGEEYVRTQHEKIFISRNCDGNPVCPVGLEQAVEELIARARQGGDGLVRAKLKEIVPEYTPRGGGGEGETR